jgi:uncharacterized protein YjbJ (UPF0337 family)
MSDSTTGAAREQAAHVKDTTLEAGKNVAGVAKEQASSVASEAKSQISGLLGQARGQVGEQAGTQQKRAASGLRSVSEQLQSMASSSENSGVASEVVSEVSRRAGSAADWLEARDPGSLLGEVQDFARRKPGTFIAIAAAAGLVVGRLTRSIASGSADEAKSADSDTAADTTDTVSTDTYSTETFAPSAPVGTPGTVDPASAGIYGGVVGGTAAGTPDAGSSYGSSYGTGTASANPDDSSAYIAAPDGPDSSRRTTEDGFSV